VVYRSSETSTNLSDVIIRIIFFSDDHIILSASSFRGFIPRNLVVRTVTTDDEESADSELVKLPHSLISEITDSAAKELKEVSKRVSSVFVSDVIRFRFTQFCHFAIYIQLARFKIPQFYHIKIFKTIVKDD